MARVTTKADLTEGIEYNINLTTKRVTVNVAGNITAGSANGVTGVALYSSISDFWKSDANANKYRFPFFIVDGPLGTMLELRNGWEFFNTSSIALIRGMGFAYKDTSGTITAEYSNFNQAGTLAADTDQPYYLLGADTAPSDFGVADEFNECIQIYGDATHGNFDKRSSAKFYSREQGKTYGFYDLTVEQALASTTYTSYIIPMSTVIDDNITASDATIDTTTPYTGMSYTSIDGNGFTTATVGSLSIDDVRQDTAGRWFICTTAGTIDAAGVADYTTNGGTAVLTAYTGERQVDGVYYAYNKIVDGNSGTKVQTYEWIQRQLRKTTDIDANIGVTQRGDTALPLASISGALFITETGVYIDNFLTSAQSDYRFTDVGGVQRSIPFVNTVSITSITAGSRLQIFNTTTSLEVANEIVAGTSYSANYSEGTGYSEGDIIRVRLTQQSTVTAKLGYVTTVVAGATGWALIADQQDDTVYNGYGLDGSTFTKFTADYTDSEIDISSASNFTAEEAYSWFVYNTTTTQGIQDFFGGVTALDAANLRINTATVNVYFDNLTTTNVRQTDNKRIFRDDNTYPVKNNGATTGGGGIDVQWQSQVFTDVVTVGGVNVITGDIADIPTATENATAVWDKDVSGYTTDNGQAGYELQQGGGGGGVTAQEIDDQLTASHGHGLWNKGNINNNGITRLDLERLKEELKNNSQNIDIEYLTNIIQNEIQKNIPKQEKVDLQKLEAKLDKIAESNKKKHVEPKKKVVTPKLTKKEENLLDNLLTEENLLDNLLEDSLLEVLLKN